MKILINVVMHMHHPPCHSFYQPTGSAIAMQPSCKYHTKMLYPISLTDTTTAFDQCEHHGKLNPSLLPS